MSKNAEKFRRNFTQNYVNFRKIKLTKCVLKICKFVVFLSNSKIGKEGCSAKPPIFVKEKFFLEITLLFRDQNLRTKDKLKKFEQNTFI